MYSEERTKELRKTSGTVTYSDPLTSFLYQLMRDHLPAGVVEKLVIECSSEADSVVFTNGWLAQYASNLAEQLKTAKTAKLGETLTGMFKDGDSPDEELSLTPERPSFNTQKDMEDELESMREEIENAPVDLLQEAIDQSDRADEEQKQELKDETMTLDDVKGIVDIMAKKGQLTEEKVKEIREDMKELELEQAENTDSEE